MTDKSEDKLYKFGKSRLIEVSLRLFHLIGVWPKNDSTLVYSISGCVFQALTSLAWTIAKSIETVMLEKRNELILLVPTTIYAYTNIYRGFLIIKKHKMIKTSLDDISELLLTKTEYDRIQKKMKFFNKMSLANAVFIVLTVGSACLNPVVSNGKELPVPIWLPYNDWKGNRDDFIFALIFSYAGIAPLSIICTFTPIIVWYLIFINSLKLEVLGQRLRMLGRSETESNDSLDNLVNCIKRHQEIVSHINGLGDTFAGVFFYQIVSSTICICSSAYLMASEPISENFNGYLFYVGVGGIYTYEIFVLIYYANEIALASDQLSFCIYESNWTCMSLKYRKMMIILVEIWKKPQQLVVGKVFAMRISILTSILNVAYSILNVLRKDQP